MLWKSLLPILLPIDREIVAKTQLIEFIVMEVTVGLRQDPIEMQ
jgi:hypothetical protein